MQLSSSTVSPESHPLPLDTVSRQITDPWWLFDSQHCHRFAPYTADPVQGGGEVLAVDIVQALSLSALPFVPLLAPDGHRPTTPVQIPGPGKVHASPRRGYSRHQV